MDIYDHPFTRDEENTLEELKQKVILTEQEANEMDILQFRYNQFVNEGLKRLETMHSLNLRPNIIRRCLYYIIEKVEFSIFQIKSVLQRFCRINDYKVNKSIEELDQLQSNTYNNAPRPLYLKLLLVFILISFVYALFHIIKQ